MNGRFEVRTWIETKVRGPENIAHKLVLSGPAKAWLG